jgi:hypothetical protein
MQFGGVLAMKILQLEYRVSVLIAGVAGWVLVAGQARADSIPPAEITVFAEGTNTPTEINVLGSLSNSAVSLGSEGGSESSFASAAGSLSAGLYTSTNGSTSGGVAVANAVGDGDITVFYEIVGPVSGVTVPLLISGAAATSASGPNATAEAYIEYGDGDLYTCSSTVAGACGTGPTMEPPSGSLSAVRFTNQVSNTLYDLGVLTSGSSTQGSGSFSAQVTDVTLSIDPAFLAANPGYSLEYSANLAPVPLPAADWLLLSGSGALGLLLLRRRTEGVGLQRG